MKIACFFIVSVIWIVSCCIPTLVAPLSSVVIFSSPPQRSRAALRRPCEAAGPVFSNFLTSFGQLHHGRQWNDRHSCRSFTQMGCGFFVKNTCFKTAISIMDVQCIKPLRSWKQNNDGFWVRHTIFGDRRCLLFAWIWIRKLSISTSPQRALHNIFSVIWRVWIPVHVICSQLPRTCFLLLTTLH